MTNRSKDDFEFIGILGPPSRRTQLIQDLETIHKIQLSHSQCSKIVGPIGISGLGKGSTAIALSIVAQLQHKFFSQSAKKSASFSQENQTKKFSNAGLQIEEKQNI